MRAWRTLTVVLGGALLAGACVFVFVLLVTSDHRPPAVTAHEVAQQRFQDFHEYGSELRWATWMGLAGAICTAVLGLWAWVVLGRDRDFAAEVEALYASRWVRAVGVPLVGGLGGGIAYAVLEHATATPAYPPDLGDLGPFMGGSAVIVALGYWSMRALARLAGQIFGRGSR